MVRKFSDTFKKQAVEKALTRSNDKSLSDICRELGIGNSTLSKWIRQYSVGNAKEQRPSDWPIKRRFEAVLEANNLTEPDLGAYCRKHGIYPHHITEWQREFENMTSPQEQLKKEREEKRQLKAELKSVQKELLRKEKALAEASALLILQKKARAIWGDPEEI